MHRRMFRTLLDNKQFQAAIDLARELLKDQMLSTVDRAVAHDTLCVALSSLQEHGAAISAGEIAVYLAREAQDWDLLGQAIYDSGVAYGRFRWLERAVERFEEYLEYLPHYHEAAALHPRALLNQGTACRWQHDYQRAADKLRQAWELVRENVGPDAQVYRRNYVWTTMLAGDLTPVPELLEQGGRYVAAHPEDHEARFHQFDDEARYAYLIGDYDIAFAKASTVVDQAEAFPSLQAEAALTLHYIAAAEGLCKEALAIGLMVKLKAGKARREDLDAEVTRSIQRLDADHDGTLLRELLAETGQMRAPLRQQRRRDTPAG